MEMDRQTIMVLFAAIVGLTLFGAMYLAPSKQQAGQRPVYAEDDIRYKIQLEEDKAAKKKAASKVIYSSPPSSDSVGEGEESSLDDEAAQEEPPIE
jgi:hypothetical protein